MIVYPFDQQYADIWRELPLILLGVRDTDNGLLIVGFDPEASKITIAFDKHVRSLSQLRGSSRVRAIVTLNDLVGSNMDIFRDVLTLWDRIAEVDNLGIERESYRSRHKIAEHALTEHVECRIEMPLVPRELRSNRFVSGSLWSASND